MDLAIYLQKAKEHLGSGADTAEARLTQLMDLFPGHSPSEPPDHDAEEWPQASAGEEHRSQQAQDVLEGLADFRGSENTDHDHEDGQPHFPSGLLNLPDSAFGTHASSEHPHGVEHVVEMVDGHAVLTLVGIHGAASGAHGIVVFAPA